MPEPGLVKTRLTPILRAREAAELAESLLLDTVQAAEKAEMEVVVAFTPARGRRRLEGLVGPRRLVPQGGGDLGVRLARVVAQLEAEGKKRLLVVGADCPALTAVRFRAAAEELGRRDLVLGPALDGGFYLLGLHRSRPELFQGVPWSTERAMEAVEANARAAGLGIGKLPAERDLDTPADLYEWFAGARAAGLRATYPRTWDALHAALPPRRLADLEEAIRA